MCKKKVIFVMMSMLLSCMSMTRGGTIAHWQFDGALGEKIVDDTDIENEYVATKFYDSQLGANAAIDVFYGASNPFYGSGGTSAEFMNDPGGNDPGAGIFVPDTGTNTALDLSTLGAFTVEAFIQPSTVRQSVIVRKWGGDGRWYLDMHEGGEVRLKINSDSAANTADAGAGAVSAGEWYHVAGVFDETDSTAPMKIYVNGELMDTSDYRGRVNDTTNALGIGCIVRDNGNPPGNSGQFFHGLIDEVRLSDEALSVDEFLLNAVQGAGGPSPADGTTYVPHDIVLSWATGETVVSTDVYLGTVREDVINASRSNPLGVLKAQGQVEDIYDPPVLLQLGQTYYWRVDAEIPAEEGPGLTISKGEVWSFTVEPYSYVMDNANIVATASSSSSDNTGPQKTIDGSGLNEEDLHSTNANDMWLSDVAGPQPTWIEYAFDKVYKLHEMRVWNQNQIVEGSFGIGAKDVTVEYSGNGVDWQELGSFEFAQGPGLDDYAYNTTVDFDGEAARYVRLTVNSNWGGILSQYGLSEVRFLYVPTHAREPQPADGAVDVGVDTSLGWRAARNATLHEVYLSSDEKAVEDGTAPLDAVSESSYDLTPLDLQLAETYYWKVNEVNEAAGPSTWQGQIWSFTAQEYLVVEDFESYTDDDAAGEAIWQTWIDGYEVPDNGSQVGYLTPPYAEPTIVHGGRNSMPLSYNNTAGVTKSEAVRTFDEPQDWTAHGANTLLLHFRGRLFSFLQRDDGSILMSGAGVDIGEMADEFRFAYKQLNGNGSIVARVDSLSNTHAWAKAGVMIRETLDIGSKFAAVYITPGNGCRFQIRTGTPANVMGDDEVATPEQTAIRAPYWIKIERNGDVFNGFYSADGATWTPMAWNPQSVPMQASVYIGLAVTSHNAGNSTTAMFSGVESTGNVTGQWQNEAIGIEQPSNDPAPLYVTIEDGSGRAETVTHPDEAAVGLDSWLPWEIPLSTFGSNGLDVTDVKKMYIGIGDRDNPSSTGMGLLYIDDIQLGRSAEEPVSTIAHWQFDGAIGEQIITDTDIQSGYVAHKFYDTSFGANAAVDAFYGPANAMYNTAGTSAELMNDPGDNDPGVGLVIPDTGVDTPLDLSTFGAFTIEAFIHPYTVRQSVIVRKYGGSPGQYYIDLKPDGDLQFSINSDANHAAAGPEAVVANEWYHVAAVFDETDLAAPMKICVNGELKGTAEFRDRPGDSPRGLGIGSIIRDNNNPPGDSGQFFNGMIDEVRFSAAALSADQFLLNVAGQ